MILKVKNPIFLFSSLAATPLKKVPFYGLIKSKQKVLKSLYSFHFLKEFDLRFDFAAFVVVVKKLWLTLISHFSVPDGCSQWLHPRKNVVCYFEGKRSVASLNPCLCTHLIYTNVGLNAEAQLDITSGT